MIAYATCVCGHRGKGRTDRRVGVSQLFSTSHAHSDSLFCDVSFLIFIAGSGSARSVPWVGAPHAGHDSDFFDVISAPQHPQNAAMYKPPQFLCLMNSVRATILQNTGRIAPGAGLGKDRPQSNRNSARGGRQSESTRAWKPNERV